TREPLLRPHGPTRQEPAARDEPSCAGEEHECDQRGAGPTDRAQRWCTSVRASPEAERSEDQEDRPHPGPEAEAGAVAAERRRDADAASATPCEQVDGSGEERQKHRD